MYFDLSTNEDKSIVLQPLKRSLPVGYAQKKSPPAAYLFLNVSLRDDPTGQQIATWLRSFPPFIVEAVDVEGLVLKARQLEKLEDYALAFPGSVFGGLSQSAQAEIFDRVRTLKQTVSKVSQLAQEQLGEAALSSNQQPRGSRATEEGESELSKHIFASLRNGVARIYGSFQNGLLLNTNITSEQANEDEAARIVDASQMIKLKEIVEAPCRPSIPASLELPLDSINFQKLPSMPTNNRFRQATMGHASVLVEFAPKESQNSSNYLPKIVDQLVHTKKSGFQILPCLGYLEDLTEQRRGVVFDVSGCNISPTDGTIGLRRLFDTFPRVPMQIRRKIAQALAAAVGNLHSVGWLHKELCDDNVVFLTQGGAPETSGRLLPDGDSWVNLTRPWLFGFEYARPVDRETSTSTPDFSLENNVYRHPERWESPIAKYRKYHDIYSLVRRHAPFSAK